MEVFRRMRRIPVTRHPHSSGCRRVVLPLLLTLTATTVSLLLGVGGGVLLGRFGLVADEPRAGASASESRSSASPMAAGSQPWNLGNNVAPTGTTVVVGETPRSVPNDAFLPVATTTAGDQAPSPVPEPPNTTSLSVGDLATTTPFPGLPSSAPATPATRVVIPSLAVDAPVVLLPLREGTWDVDHLTQEVGHLQGTASPGENSNVALAGHITLAQGGYGPFKDLAQLKAGDEVLVYAGASSFRYVVERVDVVDPSSVEITYPSNRPLLTLITCANWDDATQRYMNRVAAVAHLVE